MTRIRQTLLTILLSGSLLAGVPPALARDACRSAVLNDLHARFLVHGDIDGFWNEVAEIAGRGGYPFVDPPFNSESADFELVALTFLHREQDPGTDAGNGISSPGNVMLFANINHTHASELLFEEIGDTGVWFKTVQVPRGVRFRYRIHENDPLTGIFAGARLGTRRHLLAGDPDPLNPNKARYPGYFDGIDLIDTWVELPGASPQPFVVAAGSPAGELRVEPRQDTLLGTARTIYTYLPSGYRPDQAYPLLILFDAEAYFTSGALATTLDNLVAGGNIPPLIVLGINPGRRDGRTTRYEELPADPGFAEYLLTELLPGFEARYRVAKDPALRVIAGSSFGGHFAAWFAFHHPDVVGNVLTQSGSYHWGEGDAPYEKFARDIAFTDPRPVRFFMEVGVLEGEYGYLNPGFPNPLVSHRHIDLLLRMKGYDVRYREYGGGHEMLSWRGGIADGLIHLLGRRTAVAPAGHTPAATAPPTRSVGAS